MTLRRKEGYGNRNCQKIPRHVVKLENAVRCRLVPLPRNKLMMKNIIYYKITNSYKLTFAISKSKDVLLSMTRYLIYFCLCFISTPCWRITFTFSHQAIYDKIILCFRCSAMLRRASIILFLIYATTGIFGYPVEPSSLNGDEIAEVLAIPGKLLFFVFVFSRYFAFCIRMGCEGTF